jgi:serine/threonine protein kinase
METLPPEDGNFVASHGPNDSRIRRKPKDFKDANNDEDWRYSHLYQQDSRRTSTRRKMEKSSHSLSSSYSEKERNLSKRKLNRRRYDYSSTDDDSVRMRSGSGREREPQQRRRSPFSSDRKRSQRYLEKKLDDCDDCDGDYARENKKVKRRKSDFSPNQQHRHSGTTSPRNRHNSRYGESPRRRRENRRGRRQSRRSRSSSRVKPFRHRERDERQEIRSRRSHTRYEERYGMKLHRNHRERQDKQHRRGDHRQRMDPPMHGARAGIVSDDDDDDGDGQPCNIRHADFVTEPDRGAKIRNTSPNSYDDSTGHYKGRQGSVIADRYRVVKEVGVGTFGRVLECIDLKRRRWSDNLHQRKDEHFNSSHAQYENVVAIKVVRNVKRYHESAIIEADIIREVNRRGGRGLSHCAIMFDAFSFHGHFCMVFESLGPSLYDYLKRRQYRPFPSSCVRHFAQQLLETLEFLHSFKIIHTDLKLENLLLLDDREVPYRDGQMIPESTRIKVIDFGGATYDDDKKSSVINTRQYRAPEVILGIGWSMPSDLWSAGKETDMVVSVNVMLGGIHTSLFSDIPLTSRHCDTGCILAELYRGELLFATHDNIEHLALIEKVIGPFPRRLLKWAKKSMDIVNEAFDSKGRHRMDRVLAFESFEYVKQVAPLESMVSKNHVWLSLLLRRILVIDPNDRATARESLRNLSSISC